jgi:GT2 family glycosyltransferase
MVGGSSRRVSLAVVVVSHNDAHWLQSCLTSVDERAGDLDLEVVVVDSGSTDATQEVVAHEFAHARIIATENHGFAAANNRGLELVDSDWVLFLNPDTEIVSGTLAELVRIVSARPTVGIAAVRQVTGDGELFPTIRRFPNALRALFEALGSERAPIRASWLGERELDRARYQDETPCDWTTGAFMLVRREAIESVGFLDERFFLYCEETDYCLRVHQAGWEIRHFPQMTIVHHANKAGWDRRLAAQAAFARRQYMAKHFSPLHRVAGIAALGLGYALRGVLGSRDPDIDQGRRRAAWASLAVLLGVSPPPFGEPPRQALPSRAVRRSTHTSRRD